MLGEVPVAVRADGAVRVLADGSADHGPATAPSRPSGPEAGGAIQVCLPGAG
jgi:hypothetical protein